MPRRAQLVELSLVLNCSRTARLAEAVKFLLQTAIGVSVAPSALPGLWQIPCSTSLFGFMARPIFRVSTVVVWASRLPASSSRL